MSFQPGSWANDLTFGHETVNPSPTKCISPTSKSRFAILILDYISILGSLISRVSVLLQCRISVQYQYSWYASVPIDKANFVVYEFRWKIFLEQYAFPNNCLVQDMQVIFFLSNNFSNLLFLRQILAIYFVTASLILKKATTVR